jgi:hypothetical protein
LPSSKILMPSKTPFMLFSSLLFEFPTVDFCLTPVSAGG